MRSDGSLSAATAACNPRRKPPSPGEKDSDTHLSAEKPFFVGNFERIGAALRAARPDLVLNSGDISLSGETEESDLSAARALHEAIGLPVRFLAGNHDLGDSHDLAAHGAAVITDERRSRYLAHFGADFWTLDVPGWRLLALNTQLLGSDLAAAADQEDAIVEAAASLGARKLALFLHMPLFDKAADEPAMTGPLCRSRAAPRAAGAAPHGAAGADRLRPRPSIPRQLVGRSASCVGALDGLRHSRPPPAQSTG